MPATFIVAWTGGSQNEPPSYLITASEDIAKIQHAEWVADGDESDRVQILRVVIDDDGQPHLDDVTDELLAVKDGPE